MMSVTAVLDGDTFIGWGTNLHCKERIRVYGIDAPEYNQKFGINAKKLAQALILKKSVEIQPVVTSKGSTEDNYGRTVAIVRFVDGSTLEERLLDEGAAWVDPYCRKTVCEDWRSLQDNARDKKKGLWADPAPVTPWLWRARHSH
ncbi:MAG: thermonuclease family protein [Desulfovibrio sp.]|uniref:thermonuclease family protein n=1 Tax=Desulfovibrio sp. TaxID=885 RepID=UPI00258782DF|nr:thermonuclease family protein [Desulfovibrio sp.]MCD7984323.1 thermonuclease family protein [Desulfovibrio sp.]